jgi:hypothetical protein
MKLPIYFKQTLAVLTKKVSLFSLVFVGILFFSCGQKEAEYIAIVPPAVFTPNIPVDVDPALQKVLKEADDIYQLNEIYNIYSWQALIAINWPLDAKGKAL